MKVLMIIPAYNEEKNIIKTISKLKEIKLKDHTLDYIVINDGSTDQTKKVCKENKINMIDLPFNLGIGGAVQLDINMLIITIMILQSNMMVMDNTTGTILKI